MTSGPEIVRPTAVWKFSRSAHPEGAIASGGICATSTFGTAPYGLTFTIGGTFVGLMLTLKKGTPSAFTCGGSWARRLLVNSSVTSKIALRISRTLTVFDMMGLPCDECRALYLHYD